MTEGEIQKAAPSQTTQGMWALAFEFKQNDTKMALFPKNCHNCSQLSLYLNIILKSRVVLKTLTLLLLRLSLRPLTSMRQFDYFRWSDAATVQQPAEEVGGRRVQVRFDRGAADQEDEGGQHEGRRRVGAGIRSQEGGRIGEE